MTKAFVHKPGRGTAFPNEARREDFHPDFVGSIRAHKAIPVGGEIFVGVRILRSKENVEYLSFRLLNRLPDPSAPLSKRRKGPRDE